MLLSEGGSPMFFIRDWQTQYAKALLEPDLIRLSKRIVWATRSIAARTVALSNSLMPTGESLDLRNALEELAVLSRRFYQPGRHDRVLIQACGH
jgi:hypothetical protein